MTYVIHEARKEEPGATETTKVYLTFLSKGNSNAGSEVVLSNYTVMFILLPRVIFIQPNFRKNKPGVRRQVSFKLGMYPNFRIAFRHVWVKIVVIGVIDKLYLFCRSHPSRRNLDSAGSSLTICISPRSQSFLRRRTRLFAARTAHFLPSGSYQFPKYPYIENHSPRGGVSCSIGGRISCIIIH